MPETDTTPTDAGGLREVFRVALPLVVSCGIFTFKLFSDRMMMAWYADRSLAAALSAGLTAFMLTSFFMGVANYANAFVAQYSGADRHDRTGLAVWQSMLFSLAAGLALVIVGTLTVPLFLAVGHAPELAMEEEAYYLVLNSGSVFVLLNSAIMCFWTGRNKTWTVVLIGLMSILANVVANWILIFGAEGTAHLADTPWPLAALGGTLNTLSAWLNAPRLGVVGAGLATTGTDALSFLVFLSIFLRKHHRAEFGTWPGRVFDPGLMWRMFRYGFGNGMQMLLDIGSFASFNLLMGMYGIIGTGNVAAASGIAFSINATAFNPMLGVGAAASILVGHGIGARDVPYAIRAVKSARVLIVGYMGCMCILFEAFPSSLVSLFSPTQAMSPETMTMAVDFLRMAGAFALAEAFFILYGNAIRGAGDTRFSMYGMAFCGWVLFAIPCIIAKWLGAGPYFLWWIFLFYAFAAAAIFYIRYRQGKWQHMRVIEDVPGRDPDKNGEQALAKDGKVPVE